METHRTPGSTIRRLLPFLTLAVVIVGIYDGWIFYSRRSRDLEADRARRAAEAAQAKRTLDQIGGDDLKILSFAASKASIAPGAPDTICYGVENAKTVKLDPPVANVYPALNHCLDVSPRKKTTYTLTAEDAAGHSSSVSLTIGVRP